MVEVSDNTQALLSKKFALRTERAQRLKSRNIYPLPRVPETKTPRLDGFVRVELSSQTQAIDTQLAGLQSFVLDAVAPLTTIVEANSRGEEVTHIQAVNAATAAMELVGNASAHTSHYRWTKIVSTLNITLLPLLDEDKNFEGAAPSLF